jgi:hypothetical protein
MEMKKILRDQRGGVVLLFTFLITAILTTYLVAMEYFSVAEKQDRIITEMERASNIAVEYAMIDDARSYNLSKINTDTAKNQFDTYFKERLGLTPDYKLYDSNGELVYQVIFDEFSFDGEAPKISMRGKTRITLRLVNNYILVPIDIPFKVVTRNVNTN